MCRCFYAVEFAVPGFLNCSLVAILVVFMYSMLSTVLSRWVVVFISPLVCRIERKQAHVQGSHTKKGKHPMSTEETKALARRIIEEVWNQGNLTTVDELMAPDYA